MVQRSLACGIVGRIGILAARCRPPLAPWERARVSASPGPALAIAGQDEDAPHPNPCMLEEEALEQARRRRWGRDRPMTLGSSETVGEPWSSRPASPNPNSCPGQASPYLQGWVGREASSERRGRKDV